MRLTKVQLLSGKFPLLVVRQFVDLRVERKRRIQLVDEVRRARGGAQIDSAVQMAPAQGDEAENNQQDRQHRARRDRKNDGGVSWC